jgi:hypothetical protein
LSKKERCVGPDALPGEIDSANSVKFSQCAAQEETVGCQAVIIQFAAETGCSGRACIDSITDKGPRGQICVAQLSGTCEKTAVPCASNGGVLMLLVERSTKCGNNSLQRSRQILSDPVSELSPLHSMVPGKVHVAMPGFVVQWLPAFMHGCSESPSSSLDNIGRLDRNEERVDR